MTLTCFTNKADVAQRYRSMLILSRSSSRHARK